MARNTTAVNTSSEGNGDDWVGTTYVESPLVPDDVVDGDDWVGPGYDVTNYGCASLPADEGSPFYWIMGTTMSVKRMIISGNGYIMVVADNSGVIIVLVRYINTYVIVQKIDTESFDVVMSLNHDGKILVVGGSTSDTVYVYMCNSSNLDEKPHFVNIQQIPMCVTRIVITGNAEIIYCLHRVSRLTGDSHVRVISNFLNRYRVNPQSLPMRYGVLCLVPPTVFANGIVGIESGGRFHVWRHCSDRNVYVKIQLFEFPRCLSRITCVAMKGRELTVGTIGGKILFFSWNGNAYVKQREEKAHQEEVSCLAFVPNGNIVSGSCDGTIKIWCSIGKHKVVLRHIRSVHGDFAVFTLVVTSEGLLICGCEDGSVMIFSEALVNPLS